MWRKGEVYLRDMLKLPFLWYRIMTLFMIGKQSMKKFKNKLTFTCLWWWLYWGNWLLTSLGLETLEQCAWWIRVTWTPETLSFSHVAYSRNYVWMQAAIALESLTYALDCWVWLVIGGSFCMGSSRLGSRPLADIPAGHGFPEWIIRGVEHRVSIATT